MTLSEVRKRYLAFFKKQGHVIIPSARLVPDNDPTTLFTGSGMQPLVPYLLGEKHPQGDRLTDSQKSFRSADIEDIGDNRHTTFFEMLGNWSLGSYFKKEQIPWFFSFLVDEVGIDPKRLYVTAFIGDDKNGVPQDTEAADLWKELFESKGVEAKEVEIGSEADGAVKGMQGGRIFYYDAKKNWWSRSGVPANMPAGEPGGPDSEVFYEFTEVKHDPRFGKECHPNCDCGRFLEIGNSVFMEYQKNADGTFSKLPQRNVDFGGGLERIAAVSENHNDVFKIDVFNELIASLEKLSGKLYSDPQYTAAFRVVADHLRASVFLIGDGVLPGNADQGYFVRRLLRRAVRYMDKIGAQTTLDTFVEPILAYYKDSYPETVAKTAEIRKEIQAEEERFRKTLEHGLKKFDKWYRMSDVVVVNDGENALKISEEQLKMKPKQLSGEAAFDLFTTHGFPLELTIEEAKHRGMTVDVDDFKTRFIAHENLSRAGSEQKFKGGLGDTSEISLKYHTATHLLHQALRMVLGTHVGQKGSNITPERLRFDFTHNAKMTDEEKKKVEDIVNEQIKKALPVQKVMLPKAEAEKTGALHFFGDKYGDVVSVYFIGNSMETAFSKEFCGGPHVENIGTLGTFKIQKEEAVSAGVRRIKAVLS